MSRTSRLPFSFLLLAALCGCTSSRPMMAPSGAQGLKIWCELPSQCYERAAKECPYGYRIEANEKDYLGLGDIDGNLFIVCKQPGEQSAPSAAGATPNGRTPSVPATPELDPAKRCEACNRIGKP